MPLIGRKLILTSMVGAVGKRIGKEVYKVSVFGFEGILSVLGLMAQLVRAPPCHGGGRRFESDWGRYGILAQLGEHLPYKQRVIGSSL